MQAIQRLHVKADNTVGDDADTFKAKDWETFIADRRLGYEGEVVARAQTFTMRQVLPALPPPDIGASIDAVPLCSPAMATLLRDPALSLKPRESWPDKFKTAKMRIDDDQWELLAPELVR